MKFCILQGGQKAGGDRTSPIYVYIYIYIERERERYIHMYTMYNLGAPAGLWRRGPRRAGGKGHGAASAAAAASLPRPAAAAPPSRNGSREAQTP